MFTAEIQEVHHSALHVFLTVIVSYHLKNVLQTISVLQVVECEWEKSPWILEDYGH